MNAGNRTKKWHKYCVNGGIEETLSENIYSKEEILELWQEYKNEFGEEKQ